MKTKQLRYVKQFTICQHWLELKTILETSQLMRYANLAKPGKALEVKSETPGLAVPGCHFL